MFSDNWCTALAGCGARSLSEHLPNFLRDMPRTTVLGLCDPDPRALLRAASLFEGVGAPVPLMFSHEDELLSKLGARLDALVIASPPSVHHRQVSAALRHDIDVLVEKPAVVTYAEGEDLLGRNVKRTRIIVAFQGAGSPQRAVVRDLLSAPGCVVSSLHGAIWQDWRRLHAHTWRQQAGENNGGFIYDTGLHLLHSVIDLVGPMAQVSGRVPCDREGLQVRAALTGVSASGVLVNLGLDGDGRRPAPRSELRIFTNRGIIETDVWGEYARAWTADGERLALPGNGGSRVWQRFVEDRGKPDGNLCDLAAWLHVQEFYDALMQSSRNGGCSVTVGARSRQ
jgi:predicted dehydrogenase